MGDDQTLVGELLHRTAQTARTAAIKIEAERLVDRQIDKLLLQRAAAVMVADDGGEFGAQKSGQIVFRQSSRADMTQLGTAQFIGNQRKPTRRQEEHRDGHESVTSCRSRETLCKVKLQESKTR